MRGQAFTLEGIIAAGLVIASVVFALQVTAVTPLSASTASQHIENQQRASTIGLLASAEEEGALRQAVLYYNETSGQFHDSGETGFYTDTSNVTLTRLGRMLETHFGAAGVAFNVNFNYYSEGGLSRTARFIYQGVPSDNAVSASKTVTLYEGDHLVEANETTDPSTTVSSGDIYITKATGSNAGLYNIVEVEVVVWRM
ncbi:DUF7288 family protein [Halorarius halobius]|uniref:DUF7288 family protein n=1 Tax=Halorarius halobius TaxID=2962671 RepID=UPI0020CDEB4C|nr:hypothetical protein [Halorarius halobius]